MLVAWHKILCLKTCRSVSHVMTNVICLFYFSVTITVMFEDSWCPQSSAILCLFVPYKSRDWTSEGGSAAKLGVQSLVPNALTTGLSRWAVLWPWASLGLGRIILSEQRHQWSHLVLNPDGGSEAQELDSMDTWVRGRGDFGAQYCSPISKGYL